MLNLAHSPYAKLHNVPVRAVTIEDGFWSKRRKTNVESSIPSMHQELLDHGRMDNFLRLAGQSKEPQKGPVYSDSDMYKWLEGVAFALQSQDDPRLRQTAETTIKEIVATQEPDGYIDTYYQDDRKNDADDDSGAGARARAVLPGAHAAGRDCVLSRDRRSDADERGAEDGG